MVWRLTRFHARLFNWSRTENYHQIILHKRCNGEENDCKLRANNYDIGSKDPNNKRDISLTLSMRKSHLHSVHKKKAISQISPARNSFHKHNVLARRYFSG